MTRTFLTFLMVNLLEIIVANGRRHFRRLKLLTFAAFLTNMIANNSGNSNCQHFWRLQLLTFREIMMASSSDTYSCKQSWNYNCQKLRKSYCSEFREIIIGKMFENIVAAFKNCSWHILYRREMPYVIYIHFLLLY